MKRLAVLALIPFLAGCDLLDLWLGQKPASADTYTALRVSGPAVDETVVPFPPPAPPEPPASPAIEVAAVEVVEPEPPEPVAVEVCEPYEWRGNIVPNCHWEWH